MRLTVSNQKRRILSGGVKLQHVILTLCFRYTRVTGKIALMPAGCCEQESVI